MTMWNWLTPKSLVDLQHKAALGYMGEQARIFQRDGYPVEADRVLDEMIERRRKWESTGSDHA